MHDSATSSQNRTNLQTTFASGPEIILAEIQARGPIPFARFMELALYCPDCGFYDREPDTVGRQGHFYTNVSVGRLFGELLAFQFADWLTALEPHSPILSLVEAGAHDAKLAGDVLNWFKRQRPQLLDRIEYIIVEPSARRRDWQRRTLAEFSGRVKWVDALDATNRFPVTGIIFSNELLDAMPVHRFGWDAVKRRWFEWGVAADGDRFVWSRLPHPVDELQISSRFPRELWPALSDGFIVETCPVATEWWRKAAGCLARGKLLTLDYGLTADEWISPERGNGTLRAYHRHHATGDILAAPGEQDITAHVHFTEIQTAGESAGLRTGIFETQSKFLTEIASRAWTLGSGFGDWQPEHTRQFRTLTHPEHLGRSFRVLVQSR